MSIAALPDNVHAAILARIDLLSRQERNILQAASVASRAFRTSLLEAVMDQYSEAEIATALDGLLARDMIVQIEHERYNFRHILIRDVAYGTLSRGERIRLHSKIALWLEASAGEHLNEYIEIIAYHYREAIQFSRQSAIPLVLPFKTEDAAQIFARAGVLAGHTGSYAETKNHMQMAIDLSPEAARMHLYEQLGDSVLWGQIPNEAYRKALDSWRATEEKDPLTGARLIRKMLIANTRDVIYSFLKQEETEELRTEALNLVGIAEDEDERWYLRLTACFDPHFWESAKRPSLMDVMIQHRALAQEAAAYFEQRGQWDTMSLAQEAVIRLSIYLGDMQTALADVEKLLAIPNLAPREWSNAVSAIVVYYYLTGDYENCISRATEIFANLKPGQPISGLGDVACYLIYVAFTCGRWDEVEQFRTKLDEIRELVQYDHLVSAGLMRGYLTLLWFALARENRPLIDAVATIVRKYGDVLGPNFVAYVEALLTADVQRFSLDIGGRVEDVLLIGLFQFLSEHNKPFPTEFSKFLSEIGVTYGAFAYFTHITIALADNDDTRLAQAIDEAEAHQLIVHAARMRIVLAQRTGDHSQLERARPVLERLGDRLHLRRLEEDEQGLQSAQ